MIYEILNHDVWTDYKFQEKLTESINLLLLRNAKLNN